MIYNKPGKIFEKLRRRNNENSGTTTQRYLITTNIYIIKMAEVLEEDLQTIMMLNTCQQQRQLETPEFNTTKKCNKLEQMNGKNTKELKNIQKSSQIWLENGTVGYDGERILIGCFGEWQMHILPYRN